MTTKPGRPLEILLIRHGLPTSAREGAMTGAAFRHWLHRYDADGIEGAPPEELLQRLAGIPLLSSNLPRAMESAALLRPGALVEPDPLFREPELPLPRRFPPLLRLGPHLWAALLRAVWLLGYAPGVPARTAVQRRAREAATALAQVAAEAGAVAVVGHGLFHVLIGRELRAMGWQGPRLSRLRHWGAVIYRRPPSTG